MTGHDDVAAPDWLNVSRETMQRLGHYVGLVQKWNPAINLVSRRSLPELWDRHILDSAQIFSLIPSTTEKLVDLGSGGGFPGLVLAVLADELIPKMRVTLVEVDRRKATFLTETIRQLSLNCLVVVERIEDLNPQNADVATARALAPLVTLCGYAKRHLSPGGLALFAKGVQADAELSQAQQEWSFDVTRVPSKSDAEASILVLKGFRHV